MKKLTPFGYINGPHYTYTLSVWKGEEIIPIYVGRGRRNRILSYFRLSLRSGKNRYHFPNTHNKGLNAAIAAERAKGREVMPIAYDHGNDLSAAQADERRLIALHGRLDKKTGPLHNRNWGG